MAARGRPSDYTLELADAICRLVASGKNLNVICGRAGMPDRATVYHWFQIHSDFLNKYQDARRVRADWRADEIDDTVRKLAKGEMTPEVARVVISAHQWQAGREAPKVYGDKVRTEVSGPDGGPIRTLDVTKLSDDDLGQLERIAGQASDDRGDQG